MALNLGFRSIDPRHPERSPADRYSQRGAPRWIDACRQARGDVGGRQGHRRQGKRGAQSHSDTDFGGCADRCGRSSVFVRTPTLEIGDKLFFSHALRR